MSDLLAEAEELAIAGKIDEAVQKYSEALTADAHNPLAYASRGAALKALGRFDESAADFMAAIAVLDGWDVAREDAERYEQFVSMLHVMAAEAYLHAGQTERVYAELDAADAGRGADAASLVLRAAALSEEKKWMEAGGLLYRAEEWCFQHEDSMLTQVWQLKLVCARGAGGVFAPPEAARVYAAGSWRKPSGSADELLERAGKLADMGLLYDALRYYDACLAAEPASKAHVLFMKGIVFERLKRSEDAFSMYADALSAGPDADEEFLIRVRWANCKALRG